MNDTNLKYKDGGIRHYDGYYSEPVWKPADNESMYYNSALDSQCLVPSKSLTELREEFKII